MTAHLLASFWSHDIFHPPMTQALTNRRLGRRERCAICRTPLQHAVPRSRRRYCPVCASKQGPLWKLARKLPEAMVLLRDPCAYCGGVATALDHIVARSRGGQDEWENLTAACAACNGAKRERSLLSFLALRTHVWPARRALDEEAERWSML